MFTIDNITKQVVMTKGDEWVIDLRELGYTITDTDTVTFTMKMRLADKYPVLQKTATDGVIRFTATDTSTLQPGDYVYDVQIANPQVVWCPFISTFKVVNADG